MMGSHLWKVWACAACWSRVKDRQAATAHVARGNHVPFARINADPEAMEFFVSTMSREDSDAFVDRIEAGFVEHGFGLWAVEEVAAGRFIGLPA